MSASHAYQTWIDLTASDLDNVLRVLDLFNELGTVDELGLGPFTILSLMSYFRAPSFCIFCLLWNGRYGDRIFIAIPIILRRRIQP